MKRKLIITAMLVLFLSGSSYANEGFGAEGGIKLTYAKDENILQKYYKPFIKIGWSDVFFDAAASYYRWISYSVTDELLNTKDVSIHQPGIEFSLYPGDIISLDLGYSYFTGDSAYTAHKIDAGLLVDLETTDISFDYTYKTCEYDFSTAIENRSQNYAVELAFDITDSASWDIAYDYDRTDYRTYGYIYSRHSVRAGLLYMVSGNCFIMGGISGSADSSDVAGLTADAGLTLKLYDHVKIGAIYMFTAEFTRETVSGGGGPGSSTTSTEVDVSHTGSVSVSLYL